MDAFHDTSVAYLVWSAKKTVFVHFWGDLRGKGLHGGAEVADESCILCVGRVGIHVAIRFVALKVRADVVEGGVGKCRRLRVVVAPECASGVHDAGRAS